ncbi:MAG: hypothetical protein MHM6MM_001640 [Cercozoa sp. M6MM]
MFHAAGLVLTGTLLALNIVASAAYVPGSGKVAIALNQPACLLQFFATGLSEKDPSAINNATCDPWEAFNVILGSSMMALGDLNNKTLNPDFLEHHPLTLPQFNPMGVALRAAQVALDVVNHAREAETIAASGLRNESDPTQPRSLLGVIGPSYADSTSASSLIYSAANLMQVAPLVPAADLSDASKYPFLARLRGSEQTQAVALLDLCLAVGFKRVALLHSNDIYGNSFHANLADAMKNRGGVAADFDVGYKAAVPLSRFLSKDSAEYAEAEVKMREHLRLIEQEQLRVILLHTTTGDDALLYDIVAKDEKEGGEFQDFFRLHQHLILAPADWPAFVGLAGKKRPGTMALTLPSQMYKKNNDSLLEVELWSREGHPKRTGYLRSKKAFHDALSVNAPFSALSTGIHFVAESAYDSVVLLALAFDELVERNRTATGSEAAELAEVFEDHMKFGLAMHDSIRSKSFFGHSGSIELDPLLDRKPQYGIARWQANALTSGDFQVIGTWDLDTHAIAFTDGSSDEVIATSDGSNEDDIARVRQLILVDFSADAVEGQPGDNALLPADGPGKVEMLNQVEIGMLGVLLGVIGICSALAVIVYINMKRELRYVKMGAPNIQTIQLLGIVFAFTSILYLHLDSQRVSSQADAETVCRAFFWTEQLSFAIVFGALLAKALRVYVIFTRNDWTIVRMTDKHLAAVVGLVVFVAGVIMLVFDVGYDAIFLERTQRSMQYNHALDANVYEFTEHCKIRDKYDGAFYATTLGFQCLLMIGGLWLANELRGVSIPALNDSADVRQTMVLVFVISLLTKPTQLLVESEDPRSVYVLTVLSTFLLNFSTLLYLFAGRVYTVLRGNHLLQTGSVSTLGSTHMSDSSGKRSSNIESRLAGAKDSRYTTRSRSMSAISSDSDRDDDSSNAAGVAMATLPGDLASAHV